MLDYEQDIINKGYSYIAGADEAGRGPLCGPVVCAAVILPLEYKNELINDSKQLTDKVRRELFKEIKEVALAYSIQIISPQTIDEINILEASRLGMTKALQELRPAPDYILTDYMKIYAIKDVPIEALVKGDARSINIAAASILAKVTRDDIMDELDKKYPQYNFKKNKGYPTKDHLEALKKYGVVKEIYRFSYKPVKAIIHEQISLF